MKMKARTTRVLKIQIKYKYLQLTVHDIYLKKQTNRYCTVFGNNESLM